MAKKKVVIIGFGQHARGSWFNALRAHPDYEIMGIIDTDTEMLENIGHISDTLKDIATDTAIEDFVRYSGKPDLCIIATPIYSHHSLVREVLGQGINVICEKNLASTLQEGRQMVQAALDHPDLCTATGFQNRFNPGFWTAKQYLAQADPSIGPLGFIKWMDFGYRGETRWGWRRFLPNIYPEDQAPHWYDVIRWITGMDIVQVKADTFMPRYSDWHGASTICANLALAKPGEYRHRHKWVWCQLFGDWQLGGPPHSSFEFFGKKGQFAIGNIGLELKLYPDMSNRTKFEEDGYLPIDAGPIRGTTYSGQLVILEQMSKAIDSKGKIQPDTNFVEAFKSFAVSMAAIQSSHTGQAVWVPDAWSDFKGVDSYYKE